MTEPEQTPEPDESGYELVMPFVTAASNGGPHEDEAYSAGFAMGMLDGFLGNWDGPDAMLADGVVVLAENVPQADLIAMKHGYRIEAEPVDDDPNYQLVRLYPHE
jgi:hypothetical protein